MTAQEILDAVNSPQISLTDYYALKGYLKNNRREEVELYLKETFQCDEWTAEEAFTLLKEKLCEQSAEEPYDSTTPQGIYYNQIAVLTMDTELDRPVESVLIELWYGDKEREAIEYIEKFFQCDTDTATEVFEIFKREFGPKLSREQIAYNNAMAAESLNKPKCPTCNSKNVSKISTISKAIGASMFGLLSTTARSQFRCNNCGYKW